MSFARSVAAARISQAELDRIAGGQAGQMLRVKFDAGSGAPERFESALAEAGLGIERAFGIETLYEALVGHVEVPVQYAGVGGGLAGLDRRAKVLPR